jgi:hypothetical protein
MEIREIPGAKTPWQEINQILNPEERFENFNGGVFCGFLFAPKSVSQLSALLFLCNEKKINYSTNTNQNFSVSTQITISRRELTSIQIDPNDPILEVQAGATPRDINIFLFPLRLELGISNWIWKNEKSSLSKLVEEGACSGEHLRSASVYSRLFQIEAMKSDGGIFKIGGKKLSGNYGPNLCRAVCGNGKSLALFTSFHFQLLSAPTVRMQFCWITNSIDELMNLFLKLNTCITSWERLDVVISGKSGEKNFILAQISGTEREMLQFKKICPDFDKALQENFVSKLLHFFHQKKMNFIPTIFQPEKIKPQNYIWFHSVSNICWKITNDSPICNTNTSPAWLSDFNSLLDSDQLLFVE